MKFSFYEVAFEKVLLKLRPSDMRRSIKAFLFVSAILVAAITNFGAEFKLSNGDILRGEAASFTDNGLVVRLELGGFSPRYGWGKFTQETLRELQQNPQAKKYVDPFVEVPEEVKLEKEKAKKKEIRITEPNKIPLYVGKPSLSSGFFTSVGILLLLALYGANLYAALEIAHFRARPVPLVMGVSAVVPVAGPLAFLAMPAGDRTAPEPAASAPEPAAAGDGKVAPGPASGMGLAAHEAPGQKGGAAAYSQVYNRSNTTFDRRFFETKFTGFFRVAPADSEKDLVLVIKAAKNEYVGKRITRISMTELHLQLLRGGTEASISFGEMVEVSVRHKDAKA